MIIKQNEEPPIWIKSVKNGLITNYVKLIVCCYNEIRDHKFTDVPIENTRRNLLLDSMCKHKNEFGITFNIASENGTYDKTTFKDTGRIDICCYISELQDKYIAFECKRFIKSNMIPSHFESEYFGEGIKRFIENIYSENMNIAGMISFAETGDFGKLEKLLLSSLPLISLNKSFKDISKLYNHDKIFETKHQRLNGNVLTLTHVLMDFT